MSGFRKFRSSLHRRRRSLEAMELGFFTTESTDEAAPRPEVGGVAAAALRHEGDAHPLDFSPSAEAREIGPTPIAWLKSGRLETDN